MLNNAILFLFSALVSFGFSYLIILFSKMVKAGQSIRDEGPQRHKTKAGTPTFGGVAVFIAVLISSFIFVDLDIKTFFMLFSAFLFALIGFIDDYLKVVQKKNDGLKPSQKIFFQSLFALIFGVVLLLNFHDLGVKGLLKTSYFNMPYIYLPFIILLMVGSSNATNLTDGLDGLLAGSSFVAFLSFAFVSYKLGQNDIFGLCVISAGAIFGFLLLNYYPAKIFLGDVGSLGIGALLSGIAILLHKELLLALIGGVFVIETLSVILQVFSFKVFGRRIFKMSPLHHHFELMGLSEKSVVFIFWALSVFFGVIGAIL